MRRIPMIGAALAALLCVHAAAAQQSLQPRLEGQALVEALRKGGLVILLRHAATERVAPDPGFFDLRDCSTQRNLSEEGRHQARRMARALASLGIPVGQVLSSPYCRCLETGRLVFGRVTESDVLSVWDSLTVPERSERGGVVREMLATPPPAGSNTVLITHTGTLLYSFGLETRPEGVAHVFQPHDGRADYLGRLEPEDWAKLAGLPPDGE